MKTITKALDFQPAYDPGSICSPEEMLLFDIETTGLSKEKTQLYLIGCAYFDRGSWHVKQWLTQNLREEQEVLEEFLEFAGGFSKPVTFNGHRFDIPYLQYKAEYYGIPADFLERPDFDIYARVKSARKMLHLSSMSQKALEEYLGIFREDQLNGGLLIPVYFDFEKTGSKEQEDLLFLHNFDDIQGMLKILPVLSYADLLEGGFGDPACREENDHLVLSCTLHHPVPVSFKTAVDAMPDPVVLSAREDQLSMRIPILAGTGVLPLEPVSDYYYLVEEDRVIHKDVAQFLPGSRRTRATRRNCHLKKEGIFLPQISPCLRPVFYFAGDKKRPCIDLDEFRLHADDQTLLTMAHDIVTLLNTTTAY